jgi:hypothetical protein
MTATQGGLKGYGWCIDDTASALDRPFDRNVLCISGILTLCFWG